MSLVRSLLFSAPLIAFATIFGGSLSVLASFFDGSGNTQHRMARVWSRFILWTGFIRVSAEGVENLDPAGVYVLVANHGSYMDIPALIATVPLQFRFFAKKGLFSIPFLGAHLRRAGHLPVDRGNVRASLKSMTEGAHIIAKRRISVLLFPEGGRSAEGLREFKEGAVYIAIKAGVPIVPVGIAGMRKLLPMGSYNLRSGHVVVRFGRPVPTAGLSLSNREAINRQLYDEILRLMAE